MGYTHYWYQSKEPYPQEKWDALIKDIKHLLKHRPSVDALGEPIFINGCFHYKYPQFTSNRIHFNGGNGNPRQREKDGWTDFPFSDVGHETFCLSRVWSPPYLGEDKGFGCCKTARKPYDVIVCAVLILARYHLGLKISSDGDWNEEWLPARRWLQVVFPEISCEIGLQDTALLE